MIKISIIIPVYNSAPFLDSCIQSLLNQTFANFSICLVDDGSTDGSSDLCDSWAQKDDRISVIHCSNHGAAYARNLGVEKSSGDFLCFVDSDDTMPEDGLERLYNAAERNRESDIIVGFCREHSRMGRRKLSIHRYRTLLIEGRHNIGTLWGKLFRRSLFSKGLPTISSKLVMGEDMLINIFLSFATQHDVQLVKGKRIYNYIQRETGISKQFRLTADYEQAFHQARLQVMPESLRLDYMSVMIHRRLRMLRRLLRDAKRQGSLNELEQSDFAKELLYDIKKNHYSLYRYPRPAIWKLLSRVSTYMTEK